MKKKDILDLRNKSAQELSDMVKKIRLTIIESKLELKLGKIKNVHVVKSKQKELAQALTYLRLKHIETSKEITSPKPESNRVNKKIIQEAENGTN